MHSLILFFKGLIIGIGKVIPGVSGSLLAISLGVYQEALQRIQYFFKNKKENFFYLFPLALGAFVTIFFGSHIILYFLEQHYVLTVALFLGLISGTLPTLSKKTTRSLKDDLLIFAIICLVFLLDELTVFQEFSSSQTLGSYLYIMLLGFIDAVTMIVPGISGTATYMMLGSYTFVLELFTNPLGQLFHTILFGLGLGIGLIFMIKFVNFCFAKHEHLTWVVITGFLMASLLSLFLNIIDLLNHTNLFSALLLFLVGFQLLTILDQD